MKKISFNFKSSQFKNIVLKVYYNFFKLYMLLTHQTPTVVGSIETINHILRTKCSVSRFGDGEFYWIFQKRAKGNFEKNSPQLSRKLKKVLDSNLPNLIVCIPDIFDNLNDLRKGGQHFWRKYIFMEGFSTLGLLNNKRQYYDTQFTRPYMDYKNSQRNFKSYFSLIKKVWCNRDILMVEGEKSRFGVNSDILNNAKSVKRILCPSMNAFESYDLILAHVCKYARNMTKPLVLMSLGPTATVLAYDLSKQGIQAIDIGHLDVEYQWYKMGATEKVAIPGKYINEVKEKFVRELPSNVLQKYKEEVIDTINK